MPVIRINAAGSAGDQPVLHQNPRPVVQELERHQSDGPVIVMIHGYKYSPGLRNHCPHLHIMALHPLDQPWRSPSWPRQLGFGTGHADEGLAIAFGWEARGVPWVAQRKAQNAGRALAQVLHQVQRLAGARPVHILAHSMGIEVALEALHHIPAGTVERIISMTGASYQSRVMRALATPAGATCEFINITSRENDMFDFLFERLIAPVAPGDRAIGFGIAAQNAVTLQMDCDATLEHLARMGAPIGASERRICHWSTYTRRGILRFYNDLLRRPEHWALHRLRDGLPDQPAPRWSRLLAQPAVSFPLSLPQKAS